MGAGVSSLWPQTVGMPQWNLLTGFAPSAPLMSQQAGGNRAQPAPQSPAAFLTQLASLYRVLHGIGQAQANVTQQPYAGGINILAGPTPQWQPNNANFLAAQYPLGQGGR